MTHAAHPKTGSNLPKEGNAAFPSGRIQGSPTFTGDRMRSMLAAALLCAPAFAQTQMIAKQGDNFVRIIDKPCVVASVLMHIPASERPAFRKAEAKIEGQRYFACWRLLGDKIHLVYEDSDQGLLYVTEFKEEPGA